MTKLAAIVLLLIGPAACAATQTAATASRSDVLTAYNLCSDGDTLEVPSGTPAAWSSPIDIAKNINVYGAGTNSTILKTSTGNAIFRIYKAAGTLTNVVIAGFRFDGNSQNTSNEGLVQVGNTGSTLACDNVYVVGGFRVCSNLFSNVGTNDLVGGLTGYPALMASGYVYGSIDHNSFNNCYGECLDLGADGTGDNPSSPTSLARSLDFGGYTNGTIFIEDNIWNYTLACSGSDYGAENAFDGNSGSRWTIRHNVFNIASNTIVQALISNHELCAPRSCDGASQGDVGSLMMEIYSNVISNNGSGSFGLGQLVHQRGGRALIYSNTIYGNDTSAAAVVRLSNFRSYHRSIACSAAAGARGYATWAHEFESGLTSEGVDITKTTLAEPLDASETSIDLTSVTGINTNGVANGFAIRIGTEMIDYTGIAGNTLTGCTRGANGTTAATHSNGANVDYLKFGVLLEQINNTYIWANVSVGSAKNDIEIGGDLDAPDYTSYDIASYSTRPNNWQYRNDGTAFSYTAYQYPLFGGSQEGGGSSGNRSATVSGTFRAY